MAELYGGYVPSNVARDAKYSIRHDLDGVMKVHLIYRTGRRERALLSTDLHPELVQMVNEVKIAVQGVAGGVFYINEFRHVLVKTAERECYYAGRFNGSLAFRYDGRDIGSQAPDDLEPGEIWPGPHAGIRYIVAAGGADIYYEHEFAPRRWARYDLSIETGRPPDVRALVARLLARLDESRRMSGGRVYINEERQLFAPVPDED